MPLLHTEQQMNELARKIAKMRYPQAKGFVRRMDKDSKLELFRVSVGADEWLTRYALPNQNLLITLVERKETVGGRSDAGMETMRFKYMEARVEPLPQGHRHVVPSKTAKFV